MQVQLLQRLHALHSNDKIALSILHSVSGIPKDANFTANIDLFLKRESAYLHSGSM